MKRRPIPNVHKPNPKRTAAKKRRGRGQGAIPKGVSLVKWCQRHDPLFHVKGKERYRKTHNILEEE